MDFETSADKSYTSLNGGAVAHEDDQYPLQ